MRTVDRTPRHLAPAVDPSWLYRLPKEDRLPVSDVWEPADDIGVWLDLAAERHESKVA